MTQARDVANNNPLNLRPGQPYEGLATPAAIGGFCNFISPVFGFRAAFRNYITKFDRGVNTIAKLITEWAPPSDNNDTAAYIQRVCSMSGFGPDEVIQLKTWDVASRICYAQTIVESGDSFEKNWTQAQMAEGAYRAGIVDAPPPALKRTINIVAGSGAAVGAAATAAQPVVSNWMGIAHNPTVQAVLGAATVVLAIIAATFKPKQGES